MYPLVAACGPARSYCPRAADADANAVTSSGERPYLRNLRAGGGGHFIYGIVGDIANTASRIEQLNKQLGTRLLATEEVVAGLNDILSRPLGDFWFAGKRSSVPVVEVLCPVRDATMAQLSLCARFELAVEAFREERWEEAESHFQGIHRDYPHDGPARFYLDQRLPEVRRVATPNDSSPVITGKPHFSGQDPAGC